MSKVIFGNRSSVLMSRHDRDPIRKVYCDILGGQVTRADPERDFIRMEGGFFIVFLYGDVPDQDEFLRSARAIWLELKSDDVAGVGRRILDSEAVRKLGCRTRTSISRRRVANACVWSGSTRISRSTKVSARARMWRR